MSFSDTQIRKLRAKLKHKHVRVREVDGHALHYVEGWHVVAEANRIFGFDGWDRETVSSTCVWTKQIGNRYCAAYVARVRVTVHAGEERIVREGSGAGESSEPSPGQAHDRASKAAETDATKRALMTFGNCFGLSLYAGGHDPVTVRSHSASEVPSKYTPLPNSESPPVAHPEMPQERSPAPDGITVRINDSRLPGRPSLSPSGTLAASVNAGRGDVRREAPPPEAPPAGMDPIAAESRVAIKELDEQEPLVRRIDKSVLAIAEPRRVRDPDHLKYVAGQPCLICGREPCEAHHLRSAQPRALGRKASDAYVVPLCALHHRELHSKGNEVAWWADKGRDPLPIADQLWQISRKDRDGSQRQQ